LCSHASLTPSSPSLSCTNEIRLSTDSAEVVEHQPLVLHLVAQAAGADEVAGVDGLDRPVHRRSRELLELLGVEPAVAHRVCLLVVVAYRGRSPSSSCSTVPVTAASSSSAG